jgi:hypothetical protein
MDDNDDRRITLIRPQNVYDRRKIIGLMFKVVMMICDRRYCRIYMTNKHE